MPLVFDGEDQSVGLAVPKATKKKNENTLYLGADPEVFIKDKISGKIVPSVGKIGGLKGDGIPFSKDYPNFKWLEDNVAVEFNFPPANSADGFYGTIYEIYNAAELALNKKDLSIVPTPTHKFSFADLATPQAQVFGCDPDFSAYDKEDKERIVDPSAIGPVRFCGGHLHFGFNNKEKVKPWALVILTDMVLGLPAMTYDTQGLRRSYYGLAGLYRPKPYGFEYRTMSNWWMRPENFDITRYMAHEAFLLLQAFELYTDRLARVFDKMPLKDVQTAINNEDKHNCYDLWRQMYAYCGDVGLHLCRNFMAKKPG